MRKPGHTPATLEIRRGLDHRVRKPTFPPPLSLTHEKTPRKPLITKLRTSRPTDC